MGSKINPGSFDCYGNALPDEPMFILLARDPNGPLLVDKWAQGREDEITLGMRPKSDMAMVVEARQCANSMRLWRAENDGKWRKSRQTAHEVHNAVAGDIVRQIVKPTLAAGGDMVDVMVLLESVVAGVMMMAVKLGGDDKVLPKLVEGVEERLAEARLQPIKTQGRA